MTTKLPALVVGALLPVLAQAAEPPAAAPVAAEASAPAERGWSTSVVGREEYRFRTSPTPSESDHLIRLGLDVSAASPRDTFGLEASLGLWYFPGESKPEDSTEPFGLSRPRERFSLDVYSLNAEWRPGNVLRSLRVGRQETEHGPVGTFDGLSLALQPARGLRLVAFGGRTAHFFELDQDAFEDWVASVGLELRGENWRLEADYRLLKEDVTSADADGELTRLGVTDHSYGLAGWFRAGDWLKGKVAVRGVDSTLGLVAAAVRAEWVEQHLGADLKVDLQPMELRELNELDSPFFLTLGPSKPHLKARLDAFKAFPTSAGEFALHLGGSVRQLLEGEEEAFNRNLLRVYLLASAQRIAGTGLFANAVGQWDRSGGGRGAVSAGGALGWDQRPLRAELGTAYHRYQYVYYQSPEELADVREFYGDVRVKVLDWLSVRARYSYQIFDRNLHTLTVSLVEAY